MASAASGLPLVPLSPLYKSFIERRKAVDQATDELTEAKQAKPLVSSGTLKRLIENVQVERKQCAEIDSKMQKVEVATAFQWKPEELARQIAIIDSQLFGMAVLDKHLICQLDQQTHLTYLIDFHRYLKHSVAHQIIFWPELAKGELRAVPRVLPEHNLIEHFVRTAHLLLEDYHDFSGFAAIMKALQLPEVRRHQSLWKQCSPNIKHHFSRLSKIMAPSNNYEAYHQSLRSKLALFSSRHSAHHEASGSMVSVPWVQPHLVSIRTIVNEYAHQSASDAESQGHIVLSEPGERKLAEVVSMLELCHRNTASEPVDWLDRDFSLTSQRTKRQSMSSTKDEGMLRRGEPDLASLAPGDHTLHHWLVSRVFLQRDQLVDESLAVEPLKPGENIEREEDAEDTIAMAMLASTTVIIRATKTPKATAIATTPIPPAAVPTEKAVPMKPRSNRASVEQSTTSSSTHQGSSMSKQTKKSRLSPTAPEFIPSRNQQQSLCPSPAAGSQSPPSTSARSESYLCSKSETGNDESESEQWNGYPSPAKSDATRGGSDVVEDDTEVWKGYPGPKTGSGDLEHPQGDHSESSDEEWKGYQAAKMEAAWQMESTLKVQQHDWQGYTLETLNEDELDSSTMMDGEFGKSRSFRQQVAERNSSIDIYPSLLV